MEKQLKMDVSLEEVPITADKDLVSQVWMDLFIIVSNSHLKMVRLK